MAQLILSKRRADGTLAKVAYRVSPYKVECTREEEQEMLLEAEMNGNSSCKVRIWFQNFA